MSRHWIRGGLAAAVVCLTTVQLGSAVQSAQNEDSASEDNRAPAKKATTQEVGGAERYLTFVSTDKPIYRAGEKVYVRGVLLNASNHKPLANGYANATIEIRGPKGDTIASGNAAAQNSVWAFAWEVPDGQGGGEYSVRVTYPWEGHAPAERKFDIRAYRAPRLKSQITFLRDGYAPGDKVAATLDVKRAEGGVPAGAIVNVIARVDGMEVKGQPGKVDAKGLCSVTFDLPPQIPRGEGTLSLVIEDGGVIETASKTIPILLQTVDLKIFPEGGDLIAGYPNRVYIQARQPNGKPADVVGKLMAKDISGTVAEFRTEHEGRGRFTFTPAINKSYYLSIAQPAGIKTVYKLPQARREGAVVHADKNVFEPGQPITLQVGCTDKNFRVTLARREVEVAKCDVDLSKHRNYKPGMLHPLSLKLPSDVDGVLTVTVWDKNGAPLAERLIFRQPANPLIISIKPEKKSYVPGDQAKLTVKATDADGKPVSAVVGVTVTDDSVLEMVEKREQAPRLPVMYFLEPEVKDLADAHVYMDNNNPKAPLATDLLLGTQGWRRFGLMKLADFIEQNGDDARRAVALKIRSEFEIQKAAKMHGGFGGFVPVPSPMAAPLGREVAMPDAVNAAAPLPQQAMARSNFFRAPREVQIVDERLQIIDERPQIKDFPAAAGGMERDAVENAAGARAGGFSAIQGAIRSEAKRRQKLRIMAADELSIAQGNLVYVREFAHQVRKNRKPADRADFTETLYWNSGAKTDAKTGEATISFGLNDSVSTFRVFADGFTGDGAIGAGNV
ncbi:MAG TPA: MG2 domain-containing protein, partial [Candidatus Obscuribacterales bacterium]